MPDIRARPWFTRVAKMFGDKMKATDVLEYAKLISFKNHNQLLKCIRDRGTETARQIIRALYSKDQLLKQSRTTAVSRVLRNAIQSKC